MCDKLPENTCFANHALLYMSHEYEFIQFEFTLRSPLFYCGAERNIVLEQGTVK